MLIAKKPNDIPEETKRVAELAFPNGNHYMKLRDELGPVYQDEDFKHLFKRRGTPAESPGFLAQVSIMQLAEGLTDRQAAEAVRSRIDWKYALGLELPYTGFSHSILSEFRKRLVEGGEEELLLTKMLEILNEKGWIKNKGKQRTDSTHVLAAIRTLTRLENVGETMRTVLEELSVLAPEWLLEQVTPEWFSLYSKRFEMYRLPKKEKEQKAMLMQIGKDGMHLLQAIGAESAPFELWRLPSVQVMRAVWIQQFYLDNETLHIRTNKQGTYNLPANGKLIISPYDPEARRRLKRTTGWDGYMLHLTESCDAELPHLITNVVTTPATVGDNRVIEEIHQNLEAKELLPSEHFVDTAYNDATNLSKSEEKGIEVVGPVHLNYTWQAKDPNGYDISVFNIDWESQVVTCPQGHPSQSWRPHQSQSGQEMIAVHFKGSDCRGCPVRERCTRAKDRPRGLTFRPQKEYEILEKRREYQKTKEFKERYKIRAGVEGTINQAVGRFELRRSRYIGQRKTHLQNIMAATAMNLVRLANWFDEVPRAKTRCTHFSALAST